jgi:hypothetical protein
MVVVSRRHVLKAAAAVVPLVASPVSAQAPAVAPLADSYPRQPADVVQEMVVVAHTNLKRVQELVGKWPALARAAVDWGFGDWEDALGAASHIGNRPIAEYLIANGARPTIFSAAMLGQLDVVKAFVTASPGVQRIAGPHSISLLAHAKAGGPAAAAVYEYLERLGDAGGPKNEPISDGEKASLAGVYTSDRNDSVDIAVERGQLTFKRKGMAFSRGLFHLGDRVFFPAGAAAVRIRFVETGPAITLTINDGDLVFAGAKRV